MVSRVYVEKKPGFNGEALALAHELRDILGIAGLEGLRLVNRYDVEGISRSSSRSARPRCSASRSPTWRLWRCPRRPRRRVRGGVPARPVRPAGRLGQRVHPADQPGRAPEVRSAKVYMLEGALSDEDVAAVKHYVINPIEAREASWSRAHAGDGAAGAAHGGDGGGLPRFGRGGLDGVHRRARSGHGRGRHRVLPALLRRGGAQPHHHRDQDDRHVLVRPLPPHHVRHGVARTSSSTTRPCAPPSSSTWPCATSWDATRSRCASWTWAPSARAG